jgi:hypothetical protein
VILPIVQRSADDAGARRADRHSSFAPFESALAMLPVGLLHAGRQCLGRRPSSVNPTANSIKTKGPPWITQRSAKMSAENAQICPAMRFQGLAALPATANRNAPPRSIMLECKRLAHRLQFAAGQLFGYVYDSQTSAHKGGSKLTVKDMAVLPGAAALPV